MLTTSNSYVQNQNQHYLTVNNRYPMEEHRHHHNQQQQQHVVVSDNPVSFLSKIPQINNNTNYDYERELPSTFVPGPYDVICARGKKALDHSGNRRFRTLIQKLLPKYSLASTKTEKSKIVTFIIDSIRRTDGGFIRVEKGIWYEVGDHYAREKCGQVFRDLLHTKYKSSTKAKSSRRKVVTNAVSEDDDDEESSSNGSCSNTTTTTTTTTTEIVPAGTRKPTTTKSSTYNKQLQLLQQEQDDKKLQEYFNQSTMQLFLKIKQQLAEFPQETIASFEASTTI